MELTLFVIVGAVALVSAAMMLISENAIYSALFLILNFACIAFFFLMLNAPFLAMVQITVYAGAIMVLFLFVIMLLGAERVISVSRPSLRWMAPTAVVLALIFVVTASVAILDGEIDMSPSEQTQPHVRVIHALDGVDAIDVYLDDSAIARDVAFREHTDFEPWDTGRYTLSLFSAGDDPQGDEPLARQEVELNEDEALSFTAVGRGAVPGPMGPALVVATQDVTFNEEKDMLRVTVINALPDRPLVDVLDDSDNKTMIDDLPYGEAAQVDIEKGTRTIGLYPDGNTRTRLAALKDEDLKANTAVLWVFAEEQQLPGNTFVNVVISLESFARPSFGSPTHIGRVLFSDYVLPLEMVSLLLLVAMIGAIVLTHEALEPRRRVVRRLANPPAGLEQPAAGESGE